MSKVIDFLKQNVMVSISIVMVIAFGVMTFLGLGVSGEREDNKKKLKSVKGKVSRLEGSVDLPATEVAGEPISVNLVVNRSLVVKGEKWSKLREDGTGAIKKGMIAFNQGRHVELVPGFFSKPDENASKGEKDKFKASQKVNIHRASQAYKVQMEAFLTQRLRADLPPSVDYVYESLADARDDFRGRLDLSADEIASNAPLSKVNETKCRAYQKTIWHNLLNERAAKIKVYANPELPELNQRNAGAGLRGANAKNQKPKNRNYEEAFYPFEFDIVSQSGEQSPIERVWQWQEQVWLIDDVITAIERTNKSAGNVQSNVVKKLVRVHVGRGYVGINGNKGLTSEMGQSANSSNQNVDSQAVALPWRPKGGATGYDGVSTGGSRSGAVSPAIVPGAGILMPGGYGAGGYGGDFGMGAPGGGAAPEAEATVEGELPIDYTISHTGRKSNDTYRVKHTVCTVVIDSRYVPVFMDQISKVNINSVIGMHMRKVDLYEELLKGYLYGDKPMVELTLVIESVWLNEWVDKLMPESVLKQYNKDLKKESEQSQ